MVAKRDWLRRSLLWAALAATAALTAGGLAASGAWPWNWANVALLQAERADTPATMFRWSATAVAGYAPSAGQPLADARRLAAYQLRWRSASQLGEVDAALAAYGAGRTLAGADGAQTACTPTATGRLEAEAFGGVAVDSLAIPTVVGAGEGVLLFASAPISQTVCLPEPGLYTVSVLAANLPPPPVELSLAWNGWPAGVLAYGAGDGSLSAAELRIVAPAGAHLLAINLANDFADPATGIDRNAVIDAVRIHRDSGVDEHQN